MSLRSLFFIIIFIATICGAGSSFLRHGFAIHMYRFGFCYSMMNERLCLYGDFLFVPQAGSNVGGREGGRLLVSPGEIVVIPQGLVSDSPLIYLTGSLVVLYSSAANGLSCCTKRFSCTNGMFSPFNVVACHGNYVPYKVVYDLQKFCPYNTVLIDHGNPSINTAVDLPSVLLLHTFRPPCYHRNCMGEFMGLIYGGCIRADGFLPGGAKKRTGASE
ncbi:BnaA10g07180D [Brassica napus]|uniref:homogentisate 1,2-dioxygenase n=1 Tax=Brassica napus TaxID=3708 RepID=A0A078FN65_BRANA|nr:BnaA10g07180D [Brassica napus]